MAKFELAFSKIIGNFEGGYVDDPYDHGGETYKGIARKFHPGWDGWNIIDAVKKKVGSMEKGVGSILKGNAGLNVLVLQFYKKNFWDVFSGDILPQELGDEIFDSAVNCGTQKAITFLQQALNILNDMERLWCDIKVDGLFGEATKNAVDLCLLKRNIKLLVNVLNFYQAKHYIDLMEKNETQEKFIGWFNRINIMR